MLLYLKKLIFFIKTFKKLGVGNVVKSISGFNIGVNIGEDAGQTVMHLHVHLIPRRHGDIQDPKGGVRGVIPVKQKYFIKEYSPSPVKK